MNSKLLLTLVIGALFVTACDAGILEEPVEDVVDSVDEVEIAVASELPAFDQVAYEAALEDGKKVFLDFYASWCPTCVNNEPHVDEAYAQFGENTVGFRVNFDDSQDLRQKYGVLSQSIYVLVDGEDYKTYGPAVIRDAETVLNFVNS